MVALEALENILAAGMQESSEINWYSYLVEDCGGLDTLEGLQSHEDLLIYHKCVNLLKLYFGAEFEQMSDNEDVLVDSAS